MDKLAHVTDLKKRKRFHQVFWICLTANSLGWFLSGPLSAIVIGTAVFLMLVLLLANYRLHDNRTVIHAFLWVCTLELCALSAINNAVHDPLVIGFPLVLMYAALFGSRQVFFTLLAFMSLFCSSLILLILFDYWPNPTPKIRWQALVAINILFLVAAVSSWVIAQDFKQLINRLTRQILKLHRARRKVIQLHKHDSLTGLLSREHSNIRFSQLCHQFPALLIVFVNIKKFKQVNDAFGHNVGDRLLRAIAERLRGAIGEQEFACRFGGDEFVLVLQRPEALALQDRLGRLTQTLMQDYLIGTHQLNIQLVFGGSLYPEHGDQFEQLCLKADTAMYKARQCADPHFMLYEPSWQQEHTAKLQLIGLLQQGLVQQQFFLEYQPKYTLKTMTISSVEALVRWHSPELGIVPPGRFIAIAEESGLIEPLGQYVLKQACLDCQAWQRMGYAVNVAVNISAVQLANGKLFDTVQQVLMDTCLPATSLELELTESMLVAHTEHIDSQIQKLINLGVSFSIDDFGTGYSNLHYLSRFTAATLKIDQSFVRGLKANSPNYKLVQGIIGLAKTLGLHTIAEGIETTDNLALLTELSCDTGQGFLLSRPLAKASLLPLLVRDCQP